MPLATPAAAVAAARGQFVAVIVVAPWSHLGSSRTFISNEDDVNVVHGYG